MTTHPKPLTAGRTRRDSILASPTAIVCLFLSAPATAQCPPFFGEPIVYPGAGNDAMVITDLDRDGRPDLLVANAESDQFSVYLNVGDGTLAPPVHVTTGDGPTFLAVGDLNGDLWPDVAVANALANSVTVHLSSHTGSIFSGFLPRDSYAVGTTPTSVAIGDLNGDGGPDIVTANSGSANISILAAVPGVEGQFLAAQTQQAGAGCRSVVIGDFSGDGIPDLATANEGASLIGIHLGAGDASFAQERRIGTGLTPRFLAIGDLSGDNRPDVAISNVGTGMITVIMGFQNGAFQFAEHFSAGNGPHTSIAIGDLNGDGRPDLVTADSGGDGGVTSLLGRGDGTFGPGVTHPARAIDEEPVFATCVAAGDLTFDGRADLALGYTASSAGPGARFLPSESDSVGIRWQPGDQIITAGQNALFSITATNATTHHWRCNGVPLVNGPRFSGVTTPTLTITAATFADTGIYDVQLGATCNAGVLSQPAFLAVTTPPPPPGCPADFNHSGQVSSQDIFDFLAAFFTPCP